MPCNDKMGKVVRGFPTYMGWYGVEDKRFGRREKAFGVFLSGNT